MTTDRIEEVTIQLCYPHALVVTNDQLAHTPVMNYRCTVEIQPFFKKTKDANKVRSLRILGMHDANTGEWLDYRYFTKAEKKAFKQATLQAVVDVLHVVPQRNSLSWCVPDEAFIESSIDKQ